MGTKERWVMGKCNHKECKNLNTCRYKAIVKKR